MQRQVDGLVEAQASWAEPLGERAAAILAGVFGRVRGAKDLLNGTWLGHPVHPVVTDVPVGALTVAALLDARGEDAAADLAVVTGMAAMVASAATGAADAVDAHGRPRLYATVHGTLMTASFAACLASLGLRLGPRRGRPLARLLALAGYGTLTAGAYLGGDLVYRLGNQVDRHAFARGGNRWRALDVREVPAGTLVKAMAGSDPIVLHRATEDAPVTALHATCAHAGGPLDKGSIVDGCVACPWHGSRFDLATGEVRGGPAVYAQPRFEVREAEDGGLEARRLAAG